jgi:hypothetical protein
MPIPKFTHDGVLPPFVGPDGPGGGAHDMSPYPATASEVVATLGDSDERKEILRGWLQHRADLRALGFVHGFQWLDGSFVEEKEPKDLDVVSFFYRPAGLADPTALVRLMGANPSVFVRPLVKRAYHVDFLPIDLDGSPEGLVGLTRYYLGLFSHRRNDYVWKGMLQVSLEDPADDALALALL